MQSYNHKITKLNVCKSGFGDYRRRLWGLLALPAAVERTRRSHGKSNEGISFSHFEDVKDAIRRLSSPKDVNLEKMRRKEKPAFQRGHLGSRGTSLFLLVHCLFGKAGGIFIPN